MDGMVEENGTGGGANISDPLASPGSSASMAPPHVVVTSIVQLTLPTQAPSAQVCIVFMFGNNNVVLHVNMKRCFISVKHTYLAKYKLRILFTY